jgi:hypothetical protein
MEDRRKTRYGPIPDGYKWVPCWRCVKDSMGTIVREDSPKTMATCLACQIKALGMMVFALFAAAWGVSWFWLA